MKKILVLTLTLGIILFSGSLYAASGDLIVNGNFNLLPAGTMVMYGGSTAPAAWLLCDGSAVSRITYAALFAAIGTTYGAGDGSTTFNLPDFRRRVAVGAGGTGTATLGNAVGNTGGEETHVLTISEMPAHSHSDTKAYHNYGGGSGTAGSPTEYSTTTGSTGNGAAHNNIQPSLVVNYIIRY